MRYTAVTAVTAVCVFFGSARGAMGQATTVAPPDVVSSSAGERSPTGIPVSPAGLVYLSFSEAAEQQAPQLGETDDFRLSPLDMSDTIIRGVAVARAP